MQPIVHSLFVDGELKAKDKTLLLVGLFAARREERQMLYFLEQAVKEGNSVAEIAELISAAIISRGIPTWLSGIEAISKAIELSPQQNSLLNKANSSSFESQEQCIQYYKSEFEQLPKWIQYLIDYAPDTLLKYSNLRITSLRDGVVSRCLKELLLYAINVCDAYPKGIEIHKANAIELGVNEDILEETRVLCIYAVGVQAIWRE